MPHNRRTQERAFVQEPLTIADVDLQTISVKTALATGTDESFPSRLMYAKERLVKHGSEQLQHSEPKTVQLKLSHLRNLHGAPTAVTHYFPYWYITGSRALHPTSKTLRTKAGPSFQVDRRKMQ